MRTGALIGYDPVSTSGQLPDRQRHAVARAGCLRIYDRSPGRSDGADQLRLQNLAESFGAALTPQERRRADSRYRIGVAMTAQSNRLATATVQVQGEIAPLLSASDSTAQLFAWEEAVEDHAANMRPSPLATSRQRGRRHWIAAPARPRP